LISFLMELMYACSIVIERQSSVWSVKLTNEMAEPCGFGLVFRDR